MEGLKKERLRGRIWEIDVMRGVAVILMATFHLVFDLAVYYDVGVKYQSGFWYYEGRASAILFMIIAGVGSVLGSRPIRRGLIVGACALLVTAASIPLMGRNYIRFGILHFFAAVMILKGLLDFVFKSDIAKTVAAALLVPISFYLGTALRGIHTSSPLGIPFGILPSGFSSYDYYPIFPWAAYFCIGFLLGMLLYRGKKSLFRVSIYDAGTTIGKIASAPLRGLAFLGRHSLVVYIVHQPLLMVVLFFIFGSFAL